MAQRRLLARSKIAPQKRGLITLMAHSILVLHGPNLNLMGQREPQWYGDSSLSALELRLNERAATHGCQLRSVQSNAEHELVDEVQQAPAAGVDFLLLNPAAFTHTSIALRDALLATALPFIEVHLSNVHARDDFRQHSYFSDIASGIITGLGALGYELALDAAVQQLSAGNEH